MVFPCLIYFLQIWTVLNLKMWNGVALDRGWKTELKIRIENISDKDYYRDPKTVAVWYLPKNIEDLSKCVHKM